MIRVEYVRLLIAVLCLRVVLIIEGDGMAESGYGNCSSRVRLD